MAASGPATGRQRWSFTSPADAGQITFELPFLRTSEPALTYVFDGFSTKAVSAAGVVKWTNPLEQPIGLGAGTLTSGKAISLAMPPARFELRALDLDTGQPRWAHEVDGTEAAVVGDVVAVRHVIDPERFDGASVLAGYDVATGDRRPGVVGRHGQPGSLRQPRRRQPRRRPRLRRGDRHGVPAAPGPGALPGLTAARFSRAW